MAVSIKQIKAFAGRDGSIHVDGGAHCYTPEWAEKMETKHGRGPFGGDTEVYLSGDLTGGLGIEFDNGITLVVGVEAGDEMTTSGVKVWFEREGENIGFPPEMWAAFNYGDPPKTIEVSNLK